MNPLLLIGAVIGLGKLLVKAFSSNSEFEEIEHKDIYKNFLIDQDDDELTDTVLKQKITYSINRLIKETKGFKIGKSGNPKARTSNHKKYDKMFLLCGSSDKELINTLESHYNTKYIKDKKNDNKKEGSAGVAVAVNEKYYLYLVTRKK
ncbi:hypothetical protein [Tenacibaculum maritimum]|uniref:hypothetical protein n=1 Tax=Tenacibaculum maritimum TaxID=107401 RepID=UPI003876DEC2